MGTCADGNVTIESSDVFEIADDLGWERQSQEMDHVSIGSATPKPADFLGGSFVSYSCFFALSWSFFFFTVNRRVSSIIQRAPNVS